MNDARGKRATIEHDEPCRQPEISFMEAPRLYPTPSNPSINLTPNDTNVALAVKKILVFFFLSLFRISTYAPLWNARFFYYLFRG